MTSSSTSDRTGVLGSLVAPWRRPGRLWRALAASALALPLGAVSFSVMITLLSTAAGLAITVVLAVPLVWLTFVVARGFGALERSRIAVLLDTPLVDPVPPLTARSWLRRIWERVQSPDRWREIAHHLLALVVGVATFTVVTVAWAGSLALALLPCTSRRSRVTRRSSTCSSSARGPDPWRRVSSVWSASASWHHS